MVPLKLLTLFAQWVVLFERSSLQYPFEVVVIAPEIQLDGGIRIRQWKITIVKQRIVTISILLNDQRCQHVWYQFCQWPFCSWVYSIKSQVKMSVRNFTNLLSYCSIRILIISFFSIYSNIHLFVYSTLNEIVFHLYNCIEITDQFNDVIDMSFNVEQINLSICTMIITDTSNIKLIGSLTDTLWNNFTHFYYEYCFNYSLTRKIINKFMWYLNVLFSIW